MRTLLLDVSQAILNRTAMFNVSVDTLEILHGCCAGLQVFGQRVAADTPLQSRRDDVKRLYAMLDKIGRGGTPPEAAGSADRPPTLYLDPLYTLMAPLQPSDSVMLLDVSPVTNPAWHNPTVARAYRLAFERIVRSRPHVLAISSNSADTFRANYGYPADCLDVLHLYLPRHFAQDADPLYPAAPYVLFVGSLEARKNLLGAIRIFRLSGIADQGFELLVVGGHGHGAEAVHAEAKLTPGVRLLGYTTNEQLLSLYAGASAFLYPSYLEGFGVPLLEAMHSRLPCAVSNTGALPEVGGDLVRYADPDDHPRFASHLLDLVHLGSQERNELGERSRAWVAERFSYDTYRAGLLAAVASPHA